MSSEIRPEATKSTSKTSSISDQKAGGSSPLPIEMDKFKLAGWDIQEPSSANKVEIDSSKTQDFTSNSGISTEVKNDLDDSSVMRSKSSQRIRYEAEAGLIKKKLGDLESIRNQLGISQRKMCQLLLVDPSAWTRWTRQNEDAPPHIYRALQWYLAIQEKYPALDVNFWLSTVAQAQAPALNLERDRKIDALGAEVTLIRGETARLAEEIQTGIQTSLEKAFERKLKEELLKASEASRRQNTMVILAAIVGSLLAGFLAARFF